MIRAAFRNEMRKMWKRVATWVTLGLFALINLVDFGEKYLEARKDPEQPFALPEAWEQIFGQEMMIGFIFAAVLLILLVAAEFNWRTARQNVIDGLSRTEWFAGKVLLLPVIVAIFALLRVALGGLLAGLGTASASEAALPGFPQVAALGGSLLAGLGYGSLALFLALAIRSSGPAMAVWFAWFAFAENLVRGALGNVFEGLRPVLGWLPIRTFGRLIPYQLYDPAAYERAARIAVEHEGTPPGLYAVGPVAVGTALWVFGLILLAGGWFRRRDL